MTSHIELPGLEPDPERPATFSRRIVTDLLRTDLGFDGLIFTDSMRVRGVTDLVSASEAAVAAVAAGHDVVVHSPDDAAAFDGLKQAVERGEIAGARLDASVRRILEAKARLGLHRTRAVSLDTLPLIVGTRVHRVVAAEVSRRIAGLMLTGVSNAAYNPLRPPVAQDRLEWTDDGQVRLELRRPWSDGTTHLLFDPVELLERLAALTPRPRIHLILYHGVLAPRAAWRLLVVPFGAMSSRASGMAARLEVKILTQSPDRGNLTPKRQGRRSGVPGRQGGVRAVVPWPTPARGRLVEVIGAQPCRAKAKRRKASGTGEPAASGEAQYLSGVPGVVATGWVRNLAVLPAAFCRAPRKR